MIRSISFILCMLLAGYVLFAQGSSPSTDVIEVGETMEEYIREHHIEDVEKIVHTFASSKLFLDHLLEEGHHIDVENLSLKRKDINVGKDIDVYVKHFSEHQSFTMLMVPVDIYPLVIYDTLLFAVLEVSDAWLGEKYFAYDLENDSIKSALLALENHEILTRHMYQQALGDSRQKAAEIEVKLHESYISTSSVSMHTSSLGKQEKQKMEESWGLLKKAFSHNIALNVEMNIYIFGFDDMRVVQYLSMNEKVSYKITPQNIFTRHHFYAQE